MLSSMFRVDRATLRIDAAVAEREIRALLAERRFGLFGKTLYLDFEEGTISLSTGWRKGRFDMTTTLVRVSKVVIDGSAITFSLQSASIHLLNAYLENLPDKLPSFVGVVTGEKPAVVVDLSLLPDFLSVTVKSIALVHGAAVVTLGPSAVKFPLG